MNHIECQELPGGLTAFRYYQMAAFPSPTKRQRGPSLARDLHRLGYDIQGDVRSDSLKPKTDHIENNVDLDDAFSDPASPQPDRFCGDKKFCSLFGLSRHSGADYGLAIHAHKKGWLGKPDATGNGQTDPLWLAGKSAKTASAKLQAVKEVADENK